MGTDGAGLGRRMVTMTIWRDGWPITTNIDLDDVDWEYWPFGKPIDSDVEVETKGENHK